MFAPRGYTAVPQDPVDEEEEDHLATSYEERRTGLPTNTAVMAGKSLVETDDSEKEPRAKRNHVRFESKSLEEKQEPISKARRLCFAASLMICTLTIFVFAFTVPCKNASCKVTNVVPTSTTNEAKVHGNWSVSFPGYSSVAGTTFDEASPTSNSQLMVSFERTETDYNLNQRGSSNDSRSGGLLSLSEENGSLVWLYNASYVTKLIECRFEKENIETCLIESSRGELQLVNPMGNQVIWATQILIGSRLPSIVIGIGDCDGDGVGEVLLSYNSLNTSHVMHSGLSSQNVGSFLGQIRVISGKTGRTIGEILTIPQTHLIERVLLHSTDKSINILFIVTVGKQGHLKVIPIQKLYKKILEAKPDITTDLFQNTTVRFSQFVSLKHPPVLKDLNRDSVKDIVLVTLAGSKHSLTAVDGGKLKKMWRIAFGSRRIVSQPVIGHFSGDDIPDILVVLQDPVLAMFNQSLIQILDGRNGNILWSRKLTLAKSTSPLSARVGHNSDAFLMWIEKEKFHKYEKMFPSEEPKKNRLSTRVSSTSAHAGLVEHGGTNSTKNNKTTVYQLRHRRDEQFSIKEMEEELDSLVREVNKQYRKPSVKTQIPKFEPGNNDHTLKLLDSKLKTRRTTVSSHSLFSQEEQLGTNTNYVGAAMSTTQPMENIVRGDVLQRSHFLNKQHMLRQPLREYGLTFTGLQNSKKPAKIQVTESNIKPMNNSRERPNEDADKVLQGKIYAGLSKDKPKAEEKFSRNGTSRSGLNTSIMDSYMISYSNASGGNIVRISKKDQVDGNYTNASARRRMTGNSTKRNESSQSYEISSNVTQRKRFHDSKLLGKNTPEKMIELNPPDQGRTKYSMLQLCNNSRDRNCNSWPSHKLILRKVKYFNSSTEPKSILSYRRDFKYNSTSNKAVTPSSSLSLPRNTALKNNTASAKYTKNSQDQIYNSLQPSVYRVKPGAPADTKTDLDALSHRLYLENKSKSILFVNRSGSDYAARSKYAQKQETSQKDGVQNVGIYKTSPKDRHHMLNITEERFTGGFTFGDNVSFSRGGVKANNSISEGIDKVQFTELTSEKAEDSSKFHHSTKVDPGRNSLTKSRDKLLSKPEFSYLSKTRLTVSASKNIRPKKTHYPNNQQRLLVNPKIKSLNILTTMQSGEENWHNGSKVQFASPVLVDNTVLKATDNLTENRTSLVSSEERLSHNVTMPSHKKPYEPEVNKSGVRDHSYNFREFGFKEEQKRVKLRKEDINSVMPDASFSHNQEQTGGCDEGRDLALIMIFPNSPRNTFSVLSQEESVPAKAATLGSCDTYWPSVNSNAIVHDVDRYGFLEIFYVVNHMNKVEREVTMKVKKLSIKLNQTPLYSKSTI